MAALSPAEKVRQIEQVCPLPATASKVMQMCHHPDVLLEKVALEIAKDAGLAAQILKLANSAVFGARREVDTLERAVTMVGVRRMGEIAAGMAMLGAFRSKAENELPFYDGAVVMGGICQSLAGEVGENKGTAFLTGLLAEVGGMACAAVDAAGYLELYQSSFSQEERFEREANRYGRPSPLIGAELLERNELPESVCRSVGTFQPDPDAPTLGRLTAFSRELVPWILSGRSREELQEHIIAAGARFTLPLEGEALMGAVLRAAARVQVALR